MEIFRALIRCMEWVSVTQSCVSLRPHGLQPARLLYPWDSSGKNTGASSHSLLQGIFLTQGLNPGLRCWRQILYHWAARAALWSYSALTVNGSCVWGRALGSLWEVYSALPSPVARLLAIALDLPPSVSSTFWNFGYHSRPRCAAVRTAWKVHVPQSWARSHLTRQMLLTPLCGPSSSRSAIPSGLLAASFR